MTATPPVVLDLLRVLGTAPEHPDLELDDWLGVVDYGDGDTPFWAAVVSYVNIRQHDLASIGQGFTKPGSSVLAFVDALKARVPGPPDPEIYEVPEERIVVYVWRTGKGPKLVAFQRAPQAGEIRRTGLSSVAYWPDWWKQLTTYPLDNPERPAFMLGEHLWDLPSRPVSDAPPVSLSLDERMQIKCTVPDCEADTIAECGHQSLEEAVGFRFPDHADLNTPPPGRVRCRPCSEDSNEATEVYHAPPACDDPTRQDDANAAPVDAPLVDAVTTRHAARELQQRHADGVSLDPVDVPPQGMATLEWIASKREPAYVDTPGDIEREGRKLQEEGYWDEGECPCPAVTGFVVDRCPHPSSCGCHPCPGPDASQLCGCPAVVDGIEGAHAPGCPYVAYTMTANGGDTLEGWAKQQQPPVKRSGNAVFAEPGKLEVGGESGGPIPDGCACTHGPDDHAKPPGSTGCTKCACVRYRYGYAAKALNTSEDDATYRARLRREYVLALDMTKVTKQRTAKGYAQCQLCKKAIMGPTKDDKGKITTPGEEWVGPKPKKKGKTISMNHRAHLACGDEALYEIKESAQAALNEQVQATA